MSELAISILAISSLFACSSVHAQDISGTWQGSFQSPKDQRIVVRIAKQNATEWQATIYSLDSSMAYLGRTATQISLQSDTLRFTIAPIETSFQGKLSDDGAAITGIWTQSSTPPSTQPVACPRRRRMGDPLNPTPMMAKDADPGWEVVTVRPRDPGDTSSDTGITTKGHEVIFYNRTVLSLLRFGNNLHASQIVGAPHWTETERFDITGVPNVPGHPSRAQLQMLARKLLAERFGAQAASRDQRHAGLRAYRSQRRGQNGQERGGSERSGKRK